MLESCDQNVNKARSVCQNILNGPAAGAANFGFAFNSGKYALHNEITGDEPIDPYYSEDFDLETGEYTLTKSFNLYEDYDGAHENYTYTLSHSIKRGKLGVVTVTESGKVKSREGNRDPSGGRVDLINSSYERCNDIYQAVVHKFQTDPYFLLNHPPKKLN